MKLKITNHAIQEYLSDNPDSTNPEGGLIRTYTQMQGAIRSKHASYWIDYSYDQPRTIARYKNRAIVFNSTHIITYYKIYHRFILTYQKNRLKKVTNVLNGKAREKEKNRNCNRVKMQYKVGKFRKMTKGSLRARFK